MIHAYGTYSLDRPGNYVKKALKDCTGEEIAREWLYHLGVPDDQINKLAAKSVTVHPCMMPYITAFFMPRRDGDRPKVVPEGAVNFGFLGQLAESHPRDVIFTVEYSARTAMEAVYTLLDIERGVPEPWGSQYDVRALLNAGIVLRDGEKLKAARPDRGVGSISHRRSRSGEDRNRRAAAGLRLDRRTRRRQAHGRDKQDPSAGEGDGPLDLRRDGSLTIRIAVNGPRRSGCKIGLVRLLAEDWGTTSIRCGWFIWLTNSR